MSDTTAFGDPVDSAQVPTSAPALTAFGDPVATAGAQTGASSADANSGFRGHGAGGTWTDETMGEKFKRYAKAGAAMGIDMAATTAGQTAGALGGEVLMPLGGGIPGGMAGGAAGNALGQKINQSLGLQGDFSAGQVAGAAIGGAMPLASLAGKGLGRVLWEASKAAGVNVTAANIQSLIDDHKLAPVWADVLAASGGVGGTVLSRAIAGNTPAPLNPKQIVQAAASKEGYTFDPVQTNPSLASRALGSVAGSADMKAAASLKNQAVTNALGAQAIGMAGQPLTQATIDEAWQRANVPMQKLAMVSPEIAKTLQEVRQARYDADNARYQYNTTTPGVSLKRNPALKVAADKAAQLADDKDQDLATLAQQAGVPDLYTDWKAGLPQQAKVGMVNEHFDPSTNTLSAKGLGKALEKGAPLSDELRLIAETHNNFDDWMRDGPDVVAPGSNKLKAYGAATAAYEGYKHLGVPGLAFGVGPFLDRPVRSFVLSPVGQRLLAPEPTSASGPMLARFAAANTARPSAAVAQALAQPINQQNQP